LGAAGLVAVLAVVAFCMPRTGSPGVSGTLTLEPADAGTAYAVVQLEPEDAAEGARWFEATAWQGGGFRHGRMQKVADGTYRSTVPLPLYGEWKSMVRLHRGQRDMVSMWVYAPADPRIGKSEVAPVSGVRREFLHEQQVLRREERTDVPRWMWNAGYGLLAVVGALEIAAVALLLARAARGRRARVVRSTDKVGEPV
jgi:hypothetical protein